MSIASCFLFLLCLSSDVSNARPVPDTTRNKQLDEKVHVSDQKGEGKFPVPGKVKPVSSNESTLDNHPLEDSNQRWKDSKAEKKLIKSEENKKGRKHQSGDVGKESLVSVPWRVPHNKHGEKHPGFNLDYSPPKTHPPSHN